MIFFFRKRTSVFEGNEGEGAAAAGCCSLQLLFGFTHEHRRLVSIQTQLHRVQREAAGSCVRVS